MDKKLKSYVEQTQPVLESMAKIAEDTGKNLPGVMNLLVANGFISEDAKEAVAKNITGNPAEALSLIRKVASKVITQEVGELTGSEKSGSIRVDPKKEADERFARAFLGA